MLWNMVAKGGQLAVQMPASHDQPSHLVAERLAAEEPFALPPGPLPTHACAGPPALRAPAPSPRLPVPARAAAGFTCTCCRRRAQRSTGSGTLLTDYRRRLRDRVYNAFVARYRGSDERPRWFSPGRRRRMTAGRVRPARRRYMPRAGPRTRGTRTREDASAGSATARATAWVVTDPVDHGVCEAYTCVWRRLRRRWGG